MVTVPARTPGGTDSVGVAGLFCFGINGQPLWWGMRIVPVRLGERSYVIKIGPGLLGRLGGECARLKLGARVAIITDAHVGPRLAATARQSLIGAGFEPVLITVPAGETAKNLKVVEKCYDQLAAHRL